MGYYTYYTMEARNIKDHAEYESIVEKLKHSNLYEDGENYGVFDESEYFDETHDAYFRAYDETKWYDHSKDMREFSKLFPNVTFQLHGEGEERDDMWNEYFHNGEYEECFVHITYDRPRIIEWEE